MAEGFLKEMLPYGEIYSAGTKPAEAVNPNSIRVMMEAGIDISSQKPEHVDLYKGLDFDYVITVCDNAREICPVFIGDVKNRLHIGFPDPWEATGTESEVIQVYRDVRDMIAKEFAALVVRL